MDLLEDFQRLETVPSDDDLVSFFRQNCGGELRNFRIRTNSRTPSGFRIGISGVILWALAPVDSSLLASSVPAADEVAAGTLGLGVLPEVFSRIMDITR